MLIDMIKARDKNQTTNGSYTQANANPGTGTQTQTFQQPKGMKIGGTPNGRRMIALSKLFRAGTDGIIDPLEGPTLNEAFQHLGRPSINHLLSCGLICPGAHQLELTHKGVEKLRSTSLKVRSRTQAKKRREKQQRRRNRKPSPATPQGQEPVVMLDIGRIGSAGAKRCHLIVKEQRGRGPHVTCKVTQIQSPEEVAKQLTDLCGGWTVSDQQIIAHKVLTLFRGATWPLDDTWLSAHLGQHKC